jgi:redox-sensing transcriptional repressor
VAVEKDRELVPALRGRFSGVTVVEGDALEADWHALAGPRFLVAGNIPYNITSPLIDKALAPPLPERIVFLVQKEVADRVTARPGTPEYGALSVGVKSVARAERLFTVPAGAFQPRPQVDSAVLRLTPLETPLVPAETQGRLRRLVVALFGFRRKQLARGLREVPGGGADEVATVLDRAGLEATARPEVLAPAEFAALLGGLVDAGGRRGSFVKCFTIMPAMRRVAESTVRRLSLYLRFLEEFEGQGIATVSSGALASRGSTTSAQVRKDLSFFGSFGKRGLGYPVPELADRLRDILGLGRRYRVGMIGAGKIGSALVQYRGFRQRGFDIVAIYDSDPAKIGRQWNGLVIEHIDQLERDFETRPLDMAVLVTPGDAAQHVTDRLVKLGVKAILNFAPIQLVVPDDVVVKNVNLALELETLSYALANR